VVQQPSEMVHGRLKMSRHDLMVLDEVMADLMRIWIHVEVPFFELTGSPASY
jgi:hypothetical protein